MAASAYIGEAMAAASDNGEWRMLEEAIIESVINIS
jgi:hypothetical protein